MNSLYTILAITAGLTLIFSNLTQVEAFDPNYQIDGRFIYGTPLVCTVEFEDSTMVDSSIKTILDDTRHAINEWETKLKSTERYPKDQNKWEINYFQVPLEQKDSYDYTKCYVIIQFEGIPENPDYYLDYVGVTEPIGELRSRIIIFYTDITTCVSKDRDENYSYTFYDLCYSDNHMPFAQISSTVKHEFGHALGLGHYASPNQKINDHWASGQDNAPSIMIVFAHDNPNKNPITPLDIETIQELYGNSGFLEPDEFEIPNWIKNNARWWSQDSITDTDFFSGIEYLIDRKIIRLPPAQDATEPALPFLPNWIKDTAEWWADGKVTDQDFVNGLQYLISHGIIRV